MICEWTGDADRLACIYPSALDRVIHRHRQRNSSIVLILGVLFFGNPEASRCSLANSVLQMVSKGRIWIRLECSITQGVVQRLARLNHRIATLRQLEHRVVALLQSCHRAVKVGWVIDNGDDLELLVYIMDIRL